MDSKYLKNSIVAIWLALQNSIFKAFNILDESVPLLPFNKSNDWDY